MLIFYQFQNMDVIDIYCTVCVCVCVIFSMLLKNNFHSTFVLFIQITHLIYAVIFSIKCSSFKTLFTVSFT